MNRLKSYPLWVAIAALAVMVLNDFFNIAPAASQPYVDALMTILVAAGIVNNPSNGTGFRDK